MTPDKIPPQGYVKVENITFVKIKNPIALGFFMGIGLTLWGMISFFIFTMFFANLLRHF